MGIDVSLAKVVTFNAQHEHRVVTDPARPIPFTKAGAVEVVSVFARKTTRQDNDDGNPLIYALKGKFGYTIPAGDFREIYRRAMIILPTALADRQINMIVPLPSSSGVARTLAERVNRLMPKAELYECLDKATIGAVLPNMPAASAVPVRLRSDYTSLLRALQTSNPGTEIQMKQIKLPLRRYVAPIVAGIGAEVCKGRAILLVDDIFGSGSSLQSAGEALSRFKPAAVSGLTLLGRLS